MGFNKPPTEINMKPELGQKYLITTDNWFFAPNGEQYMAVFGTVHSIDTDTDTLGVQTNRHSSNWYVQIGNMIVAGCQIHYAIRTDSVSSEPPTRELSHEGVAKINKCAMTRIYMADAPDKE